MQIVAPTDRESSPPSNYYLGEHVGNISREVASVLASVMDVDDSYLPLNNVYDAGFKFQCLLLEDSNHTSEGFAIKVIVLSVNKASFTDRMMHLLYSKGLEPLRID